MLEDRQGNLWLSTNRGLCQYDPQRRGALEFLRAATACRGMNSCRVLLPGGGRRDVLRRHQRPDRLLSRAHQGQPLCAAGGHHRGRGVQPRPRAFRRSLPPGQAATWAQRTASSPSPSPPFPSPTRGATATRTRSRGWTTTGSTSATATRSRSATCGRGATCSGSRGRTTTASGTSRAPPWPSP